MHSSLRALITRLVAAGLSILSLGMSTTTSGTVRVALLLVGSGLFITWATSEARAYKHQRPHLFKSEDGVRSYLYDWIESGGKTAIFTRNHSWANDDSRMRAMLLSKARGGDLEIFLPQETDLTRELEEAGAHVHYYGNSLSLKSRFTMIRVGSASSQVAIGRQTKDRKYYWRIDEFQDIQDPAYHFSDDLREALLRISDMDSA